MASVIEVGGKKFNPREIVEYTSAAGVKKKYMVLRKSADRPLPGLILKELDSERQFSINSASVAARINKIPQEPEPSPSPSPVPPSPAPSPAPSTPPPATPWVAPQVPKGPGRFKRFVNWLKPKGDKKEAENPRILYELLIGLALLFHIVDGFKFHFDSAHFAQRLVMYFVLAVATHFILNREWPLGASILELAKVLVWPLFIIPMTAEILTLLRLSPEIVQKAAAIAWAFPVFIVYIMFIRDVKYPLGRGWTRVKNLLFTPSGLSRVWFFALSVAALYLCLSTIGDTLYGGDNSLLITAGNAIPGAGGIAGGVGGSGGVLPPGQSNGFDPGDAFVGMGDFLQKSLNTFSGSVKKLFGGISNQYNTMKNDSLGSYYTGQVEQNKEQTGVFITEFSINGKQYDSMPLTAFGYIKARSFVEDITIKPTCLAQSMTNKSKIYEGRAEPSILEDINPEDQRGVICTFENFERIGGMLPADRYQVTLSLDFQFTTWAYKQYYFLDRTYLLYLKTTGIDPNAKLQIPLKTKAIYTNGPVMIGMDDALEMPVGISNENDNYIPLGMTVDEKSQMYGARGEVMRIYQYTLRLPEGFELMPKTAPDVGFQCTVPSAAISKDDVAGYNKYTFNIEAINNNIVAKGAYMTLNCNVKIPKEKVANIIPGANSPALVTVVGTVKYDYKLSKSIPVIVEKTP